jgi:hypothetical protein
MNAVVNAGDSPFFAAQDDSHLVSCHREREQFCVAQIVVVVKVVAAKRVMMGQWR